MREKAVVKNVAREGQKTLREREREKRVWDVKERKLCAMEREEGIHTQFCRWENAQSRKVLVKGDWGV